MRDGTGIRDTPGYAIASAHPAATEAGMKILREGGNAFDAAIVVSSMLGVVEPQGSGIGGGGFFLLHTAENGRTIFLDARERAPLEAHRDMYLDSKGQVDSKLSLDGPLAAGIPGIPAAWGHLAGHYGTLPLEHTLKPAIAMARRGSLRIGCTCVPARPAARSWNGTPNRGYTWRRRCICRSWRTRSSS